MTSAYEYLKAERLAPLKSEYRNGHVFAMAACSPEHVLLEGDLLIEIEMALRSAGGKCRAFGSNLKVWMPGARAYSYPDVSVVSGELKLHDPVGDVIENPLLIVEVLSPSTERYDRTAKFDAYCSIPTFRQYVLVSQAEPRVEVFTKSPEGFWVLSRFNGLDAIVDLSTLGIKIPMAAIYGRLGYSPLLA